MSETLYYTLSAAKVLEDLKSSGHGLQTEEVIKRNQKYGYNELPQKKSLSAVTIFFSQFRSPLIYILLIAAIVSFSLQEFIDGGVILTTVIINTIVGFLQENKAQNALLKLRQAVVVKAKVRRDGATHEVDARELVPGDIIELEAGDKVPADARILSVKNIQVNEAVLTGESWEVDKHTAVLEKDVALGDRANMFFMGTVLTAGKAEAVVVATGISTEIGKIAHLLSKVEDEKTPLQIKVAQLSKQIGLAILGMAVFILLFGLYHGYYFFEKFKMSVEVAFSAVPEGLIVALTAVLAIGMQKILKKNGLVRKLVAAEALGSTTVICTDKTGTITSGEMQVTDLVTSSFHFDTLDNIPLDQAKEGLQEILEVLKVAVLCNEAVIEHTGESLKEMKMFGSMTEKALLIAGENFGLHKPQLLKEHPQFDVLPFDSTKKYMASLHTLNSRHNIMYVKGAPEIILEKSNEFTDKGKVKKMTDRERAYLIEQFNNLSNKGLRILALSYCEVEAETKVVQEKDVRDLVFMGFVGIKDPIREGVRETLLITKKAGIKVAMITGDHKLTAKAIAQELGIKAGKDEVLTGQELAEMTDKEFYEIAPKINVYARVSPADKLRIVNALQKQGEVVAMTGDGVNDAPALKAANIGVAMGSGTEVAKGASDLVILDNHFSTIVAAVEQGRVIYDNIKKVVLYLMSDSLAEVIIIVVALLLGWPLPILATQILWVNIIDDGFPGMALTVDPEDTKVMKEKPGDVSKDILNNENKLLILLISLSTALTTLGIFYFFWKTQHDIALARTAAFTGLALSTLMYVFSCRSLRHDFMTSIRVKNWYLVASVIFGFLMQLLAVYAPFFQRVFHTVPLGLSAWALILLQGIIVIGIIEVVKWIYIVKYKVD